MKYDTAIQAVADGTPVRRSTWPPDTFLIRVPGSTITVEADRPLGQAAPALIGKTVRYLAHIDLYRDGELSPYHPQLDDRSTNDWETA